MKWSMMVRENVMQVNLEPENDHEREALEILRKYEGPASIHKGVSVAECQGGYMRNFGPSDALAITIHKSAGGE
jgi:hypothetical protein